MDVVANPESARRNGRRAHQNPKPRTSPGFGRRNGLSRKETGCFHTFRFRPLRHGLVMESRSMSMAVGVRFRDNL